jgi:beta-N-acetylhexosaminidase
VTGTAAAIFGCAGCDLGADEAAFFREADPFGFILFGRNVDSPDQLRRLTSALRDSVGRDALILIDQEGGRVQRLRGPAWREWSPPLDMVTQARDPARAMWLRARLIADELRDLGIDANCAPCADIAGDATHPFLKNRCYGNDAATVTTMAAAVADGLMAGGVVPVIKHLPGHGRATADTHRDLPTVTASLADLRATDFAPFAALNHLPMAMTAHIIFSTFDDKPATQSPVLIDVIRHDIGFNGLLMTDDLNMQALSGSLAQRTSASMAAGCDIALHCNGDLAEMQAVARACGAQTPAIRTRATAAVAARQTPQPADIAALLAEYHALVPEAVHG